MLLVHTVNRCLVGELGALVVHRQSWYRTHPRMCPFDDFNTIDMATRVGRIADRFTNDLWDLWGKKCISTKSDF